VSSSAGWIDLPNITLRTTGDWAIFIATPAPAGDHDVGTVFSIGTPSATLFKDPAHLSLIWCGRWASPFSSMIFPKSFVATGRDDANVSISNRFINPGNGALTLFGMPTQQAVAPLVSFAGLANNKNYGIVIQRRAGRVELWAVDGAGPRLMDDGDATQNFTGITNKSFRLCAALLPTQPTTPSNYWKKSVQALIVYNGGALTEVQMQRLFNGAHAQSILTLQASRDDRYYPGTIAGGQLEELVGNKHGTFNGTIASGATLLPTTITDDVIVDMDGGGQVLPKDPHPATTSKPRFWGTRIGATTDIRMRVVRWNSAIPATPTDVILDWQTVATGVQNNQTWIGEITGVPHAYADYDCEVSWKVGGNWNTGKRLNRQWSLGVPLGFAGQSILETMSTNGPSRNINTTVAPYLRGFHDIAQNAAAAQDHRKSQGWQARLPAGTFSTATQWGENRMSEQLALLTGTPVGVGNLAVAGSSINWWLTDTAERWRPWKRFIQRYRPQIGIWGNGQGDSADNRAERWADLDTLLALYDNAVQTAPGGPWNYMFYVFPVNGNWNGSYSPDSIRSHDIEWVKSRAAQGKPVALLCTLLDGATVDGTHLRYDDSGHGLLASRMAQTVAHGVGAPTAPADGNGPVVNRDTSSWTTSGGITTITLRLTPNGGTAIVTAGGGSPSGFKVKLDNGAYTSPATAQITSPTTIVLTIGGTPVNSVAVTYLAGGPGPMGGGAGTTPATAGTDNAIYDNRGDMTGLRPGYPMAPITGTDPLVMPVGAAILFFDDFDDGNANGWTPNVPAQWPVVVDSGDNAYKWDFNWTNQTGICTAGLTTWTNYRFLAEFKITELLGWSETHLYIRYTDTNNYYRLMIQDRGGYRQFMLQKRVGGVLSNIGAGVNVTINLNVWYDLEIAVNDDTVTVFLGGIQLFQRTDSSHANGKIGIGAWKQDILFDNIEVK
jgi:hypothetical protein